MPISDNSKKEKVLSSGDNADIAYIKESVGPLILVVEDDKFLRDIISQKLKSEGYNIEEAVDGNEAYEKIEKLHPKLILLDLILPDLDGFGVLKKMMNKSDLSKIPVLVFSNLGQDEDVEKAKQLGAKDYLVKAYFTPNEIVDKIKKILREVYF